MKFDVLDLTYNLCGEFEVSDAFFAVEPRADIIGRVVRWQLAKRRAGTHQTKTISQVSGSGKKIVKQKGSGGARHGSRRGTQFRGGGIVFGPTTRSYEYGLQKKVRRLGLRMAIVDKVRSGEFVVLRDFALEQPNTKKFISVFEKNGVGSALLVDDTVGDNLLKSVRSADSFDAIAQIGVNVYDVLRKDYLIMSVSALESVVRRLHV
ncbi:MAG: 50S ribosomal protein L4 [Holosporales bacterium]|jgi:large subunit ribosomal protein L4|nr:50S ribosomal protein L4 [Holosporales bacterium]